MTSSADSSPRYVVYDSPPTPGQVDPKAVTNGHAAEADPRQATPEAETETATAGAAEQRSWLRRYWWLLLVAAAILGIGGVAVYRLRTSAGQTPTVSETQLLSVRTAAAQQGPVRDWASSEGTVRAIRFKHLAFDVAGDVTYITQRNGRTLRAGDRVEAGELLAQIDDRTLQADINQARAAVAEARQRQAAAGADVAQAQTQVAQARSQVDQALAQLNQAQSARNLAQTNFQRYQTLYSEGAISAAELDSRRNTLEDATAQVQAARSQVETARSQVETAQAQVQAAQDQRQALSAQIETAQARLSQAQVALEDTRLYAPFDGVVAYMNIRENEYYTPQAVSSQLGQDYQAILDRVPIVVVDPSQYEVVADFASAQGEQVEPGQTSLVASNQSETIGERSDSLLQRADARGQVFAVNPAVSPGGRSIEVTTQITEGGDSLKHGESVTLWVAIAADTDAVTVPLNAVVYREQEPYVFVVNPDDGSVEQRPVELGIEGLNQRQIRSGVAAGEQVVIAGQNRLVDGASVQVVDGEPMAESPEAE